MVPCGWPHKPLATTQCAQAQPGKCPSYLRTSPKPKAVTILDEMPMTNVGKIYKPELRAMAAKAAKVAQ
jgi:acyl-CoA synthetase (AMP-forming)/AMP-acid ligase II